MEEANGVVQRLSWSRRWVRLGVASGSVIFGRVIIN